MRARGSAAGSSWSEGLKLLTPPLLAGGFGWYFGLDVWHAILLGVAVTVVLVAAVSAPSGPLGRDVGWGHEERMNRSGSRDDITSLSWSMRSGWGMVGRTAEIRVRQLARRRLALEGLSLDNPKHHPMIEQRLGSAATKIIVRENILGLRLKTMLELLDALDGLDPTFYEPPHTAAPVQPRRRDSRE